jgi:hypothetical protein
MRSILFVLLAALFVSCAFAQELSDGSRIVHDDECAGSPSTTNVCYGCRCVTDGGVTSCAYATYGSLTEAGSVSFTQAEFCVATYVANPKEPVLGDSNTPCVEDNATPSSDGCSRCALVYSTHKADYLVRAIYKSVDCECSCGPFPAETTVQCTTEAGAAGTATLANECVRKSDTNVCYWARSTCTVNDGEPACACTEPANVAVCPDGTPATVTDECVQVTYETLVGGVETSCKYRQVCEGANSIDCTCPPLDQVATDAETNPADAALFQAHCTDGTTRSPYCAMSEVEGVASCEWAIEKCPDSGAFCTDPATSTCDDGFRCDDVCSHCLRKDLQFVARFTTEDSELSDLANFQEAVRQKIATHIRRSLERVFVHCELVEDDTASSLNAVCDVRIAQTAECRDEPVPGVVDPETGDVEPATKDQLAAAGTETQYGALMSTSTAPGTQSAAQSGAATVVVSFFVALFGVIVTMF